MKQFFLKASRFQPEHGSRCVVDHTVLNCFLKSTCGSSRTHVSREMLPFVSRVGAVESCTLDASRDLPVSGIYTYMDSSSALTSKNNTMIQQDGSLSLCAPAESTRSCQRGSVRVADTTAVGNGFPSSRAAV
jgi:hypothetical protein